MTNVFKIRAECFVCSTPVDGKYKRGRRYYCAADFQRTSPQERAENKRQEKKLAEFKRIFTT